jgi:hypothetical protein
MTWPDAVVVVACSLGPAVVLCFQIWSERQERRRDR